MNSVVRHIAIERQVSPKVSHDDFRGAMRQLTGGVSVITVGRGKDISGMTVTSVSSLSVDPPALIVSINRGASSWPLLKRYGVFGGQYPDVGSDRRRGALCRQGWPQGRRTLCRR